MSSTELTKAEQRYFHPDRNIAFGIPDRCASCPFISYELAKIEISEKIAGNPDSFGNMAEVIREERQKRRDDLIQKTDSCSGYERLTDDEISPLVAVHEEDGYMYDNLGKVADIVGYRCGETGQTGVATTYINGVVGAHFTRLPFEFS
jgi:hypothetical protein